MDCTEPSKKLTFAMDCPPNSKAPETKKTKGFSLFFCCAYKGCAAVSNANKAAKLTNLY
jgi:hypothetical protein